MSGFNCTEATNSSINNDLPIVSITIIGFIQAELFYRFYSFISISQGLLLLIPSIGNEICVLVYWFLPGKDVTSPSNAQKITQVIRIMFFDGEIPFILVVLKLMKVDAYFKMKKASRA